MKIGKLYKLLKMNNVPELEWVFLWDHPYPGNCVIDKLPTETPYMFLGCAPMMNVWHNVLYGDKRGWIHLRYQTVSELTDNGS